MLPRPLPKRLLHRLRQLGAQQQVTLLQKEADAAKVKWETMEVQAKDMKTQAGDMKSRASQMKKQAEKLTNSK